MICDMEWRRQFPCGGVGREEGEGVTPCPKMFKIPRLSQHKF